MNIKAVIFDLDGTLVNSLIDIKNSVNTVLEKYNYPIHHINDYKYMIGNGIEVLVKKAFPDSISESELSVYLKEVKEIYLKNQINESIPYEGIIDMLKELEKRNIKISILSNKQIDFTKLVVEHFFSDIDFFMVLGGRKNIPLKPDPTSVNEIINSLNISKEEILYIGDTATDMQTALAGELKPIGVSWGFRSVEELKEAGAVEIINHPKELIDLL